MDFRFDSALHIPHPRSPLSLPLLMLRILANNAHNAFAVNHLTFVAHLFYRRSYFHFVLPILLIAISYSSAFQVVGRQLDQNLVARQDADKILAHLS